MCKIFNFWKAAKKPKNSGKVTIFEIRPAQEKFGNRKYHIIDTSKTPPIEVGVVEEIGNMYKASTDVSLGCFHKKKPAIHAIISAYKPEITLDKKK